MGVMNDLTNPDSYPSPTFSKAVASIEFTLFFLASIVLGISLIMFLRLYGSLSPPNKILAWIIGPTLAVSLLYLEFATEAVASLSRGQYVAVDNMTCHYLHSFVRACHLFTWFGQPILAHVTFKTIKCEPVSDTFIKRFACVAFLLSLSYCVWSQLRMPGFVIMGTYCGTPPVFVYHSSGPRMSDPRVIYNIVAVQTLIISIVKYTRCSFYLRREEKKLEKEMKTIEEIEEMAHKTQALEGEEEKGEEEVQSVTSYPLPPAFGRLAKIEGEGGEDQSHPDLERGLSRRSPLPSQHQQGGDGASTSPSSSSFPQEENESLRTLSSSRAMNGDGREQALIVEMEERVRAAQIAAVLMLLPVPHKAESAMGSPKIEEEHKGKEKDERDVEEHSLVQSQFVDEEEEEEEEEGGEEASIRVSHGRVMIRPGARGEDLMAEYARRERRLAEVEEGRHKVRRREKKVAAAEEDKEEPALLTPRTPHEVAALLHTASRTLIRRAVALLCVYYSPFILIMVGNVIFKYGGSSYGPTFVFLRLTYSVASPILQSYMFVHIIVTTGGNLLQLYGEKKEEEEKEEEEEAEPQQPVAEGEKKEEDHHISEGETKGEGKRRDSSSPSSSRVVFMYEQSNLEASDIAVPSARTIGSHSPHSPLSPPSSSPATAQDTGAQAALVRPLSSHSSSSSSHQGQRRRSRKHARRANPSPPMQALSTIYEVAFKKKGLPLPPPSSFSSVKAGMGGEGMDGSTAAVNVDERWDEGGVEGSRAALDRSNHTSTTGAATSRSSQEGSDNDSTLALQRALVREVLGINVTHTVSPSSSSGGGGSSGTSNSNSNSVSGNSSSAVAGAAPASSSSSSSLFSSRAPSGTGTPYLPLSAAALRGLARPSPCPRGRGEEEDDEEEWMAEGRASDVSSLTDTHDYIHKRREELPHHQFLAPSQSGLSVSVCAVGGWVDGGEEGEGEEEDELEHHDYVQDRSEASSRDVCEWVKERSDHSRERISGESTCPPTAPLAGKK